MKKQFLLLTLLMATALPLCAMETSEKRGVLVKFFLTTFGNRLDAIRKKLTKQSNHADIKYLENKTQCYENTNKLLQEKKYQKALLAQDTIEEIDLGLNSIEQPLGLNPSFVFTDRDYKDATADTFFVDFRDTKLRARHFIEKKSYNNHQSNPAGPPAPTASWFGFKTKLFLGGGGTIALLVVAYKVWEYIKNKQEEAKNQKDTEIDEKLQQDDVQEETTQAEVAQEEQTAPQPQAEAQEA